MAKLTEYQNPITGQKGNLLDFSGLWSQVLGVFILFLVFATGQNISKKVASTVPIDTNIDPIIHNPVPAKAGKREI